MAHFLEEESSEMLRDSYSDYLRDNSVFPKLLEILEKLQQAEDKPKNPINFIREELGDTPIAMESMINLERELEDAQNEIRRLQQILRGMGVNYDKENFADALADCCQQSENVPNCSKKPQ